MKFFLLILFLGFGLFDSCLDQKDTVKKEKRYVKLQGVPYNIHDADNTLVLARELNEISGLAFNEANQSLFAVNDELGYLYELRESDGSILSKKKFADLGDFEGLEIVGEEVVITRSNGRLHFYDPLSGSQSRIIRTELSTKNNVEGITYLPESNSILLACKASPHLPDKIEETKGKLICALHLDNYLIDSEPYSLIKDKQLKRAVKSIYQGLAMSENQLDKLLSRVENFAPSGMAVHPISSDLYVLSARRSLIVVLDSKKEIKHIHFLDEKMHIQPEGICFSPEGTMYISNEGKGGNAKVFQYRMQS